MTDFQTLPLPTIDRDKIADLSDESLDNRIRSLSEVIEGYDSKDKEGVAFQTALAAIASYPIEHYRAVLRVLRKEKRRRLTLPKGLRMPRIVPWTDFVRDTPPDLRHFETPEAWDRYRALAQQDQQGRDEFYYHDLYVRAANDEAWINSRYRVIKRFFSHEGVDMVHLSIKRIDQQSVHDWRDLQRIKTELVGAECEAVELFPMESRMIDCANQYHLWCFVEPGVVFPFGFFEGRMTLSPANAAEADAGQREFEG